LDIFFKDRKGPYPRPEAPQYPYLILQRDNWNDYSFRTLFQAFVQRDSGAESRVRLGDVKVMRKAQPRSEPTFPENLFHIPADDLVGSYCSLSSDEDYYQAIHQLGEDTAIDVLTTLQDAAFLPDVRRAFQEDECFKISLLRESSARRLLDEAGRLFGAQSQLVNSFSAKVHLEGATEPHHLTFDFGASDALLPRRIHALVGLNGVGKTQVMARLAMLLSRFSRQAERDNRSVLESEGSLEPVPSVYNVVALSFSAFDDFERPTERQGEKFSYSYCGLRTLKGRLRTEEELLLDIKDLIVNRMDDERREVLARVLTNLVKVDDLRSFVFDVTAHAQLYARLSAGQRIVLNSLSHLLSKISKRTLVMFDEPELHLHPQLLSSMMSAMGEILREFDSFAILATHSPIVVQQLPRECVQIVRRDRMKPIVLRPNFETFGENLTEIARHIFVATESDRDYRNTLEQLYEAVNYDVGRVAQIFDGRLSLNARIFLESLSNVRGGMA